MIPPLDVSEWISLTKPRIIFLLCISGIGAIFASGGTHVTGFFGFLIALALIAASASVSNCYYDRELDKKMERTRKRPLPNGDIKPVHALIFALGLFAAGTVIGLLTIPIRSMLYIWLGFCAYVFVYTVWLKRSHWLGVVLGGSAGSFPVLAGWAANGPVEISGVLMAIFVFMWTPAHAWVLEFVFRDQYERAGIPTYPVVKDLNQTAWGVSWAALTTVASALMLIPFTGPIYSSILIGSTPMFLFSYYMFFRNRSESEAVHAFFSSNLYLTFLFVGWAIDGYLNHPQWIGLYALTLLMPPAFLWIWQVGPSLGPIEASISWTGDEPVPTPES